MNDLFPSVPLLQLAQTAGFLFLIIVIRYFIIAGLFYYLLWKRKTVFKKLQDTTPVTKVIREEIFWSVVTSVVFAIPGAYMIEAWKQGGTLIYSDINEYGWMYLLISFPLYMFIHDTYFYWTHRLLHLPRFYRRFHKVHHNSPNPTPWAAFSFHPYEGVIEAAIVPLMTFIIPVHVVVLLIILTLMTFFSVVNHCGYEIYGQRLSQHFFGKIMITPTHHNLHHSQFDCNYGLYFRFWDRVIGTDKWAYSYDEVSSRRTRMAVAQSPVTKV